MVLFFFFFKQKTAYEMRISDWSSDVCSSDLYVHARLRQAPGRLLPLLQHLAGDIGEHRAPCLGHPVTVSRFEDIHVAMPIGATLEVAQLGDHPAAVGHRSAKRLLDLGQVGTQAQVALSLISHAQCPAPLRYPVLPAQLARCATAGLRRMPGP